jgi:cobyrinic acid a,c-diamide synthase
MQGLIIAGTHSGCGKTTITMGILAALTKKGYKVQAFKTGPDFIDTGLHGLITGRMSRNLDIWMCGTDYVRECFIKHARDVDMAVVEGVMGLYDGDFSTAHLATLLGLPVVLVIDAYGMAESAGAIVKGYRDQALKSRVNIVGVIFNRIASEKHLRRVRKNIKDIPVLGYLPREEEFEVPHRHLGLVTAEESPMTSEEINKLADAVLECINIDELIEGLRFKIQTLKPRLQTPDHNSSASTTPVRIGVAYDRAFCFYYQDNLDLLKRKGAEIIHFSPLSDKKIPDDIDALYIGGGYPELYAERLSRNQTMLNAINKWAYLGKPIYAECGGFMYLTEGIYTFDEVFYPMVGVFPLKTKMTEERVKLGYREITLKEKTILGEVGDRLRGHEFHYSDIDTKAPSADFKGVIKTYSVKDADGKSIKDEGYWVKNTLGSYIHIHFASNKNLAENFIRFILNR